jgi:hypothetical protein
MSVKQSPFEQTGTASSLALLAVTGLGVITHAVAEPDLDELTGIG